MTYTDDAEPWVNPTPKHYPNKHIRPWTREKTERREAYEAWAREEHARIHAASNVMTPCRICHEWPKPKETAMSETPEESTKYVMPEMQAMSDAVETLSMSWFDFTRSTPSSQLPGGESE